MTTNEPRPVVAFQNSVTMRASSDRLNGRYCAILSQHMKNGYDDPEFFTYATDDHDAMIQRSMRYMADNRALGLNPYVIVWDRKIDKIDSYLGSKAGYRVLDKAAVRRYMREEA